MNHRIMRKHHTDQHFNYHEYYKVIAALLFGGSFVFQYHTVNLAALLLQSYFIIVSTGTKVSEHYFLNYTLTSIVYITSTIYLVPYGAKGTCFPTRFSVQSVYFWKHENIILTPSASATF